MESENHQHRQPPGPSPAPASWTLTAAEGAAPSRRPPRGLELRRGRAGAPGLAHAASARRSCGPRGPGALGSRVSLKPGVVPAPQPRRPPSLGAGATSPSSASRAKEESERAWGPNHGSRASGHSLQRRQHPSEADRATHRATDLATDHATDRATGRSTDRATDCVTDRATDRATDCVTDRATDCVTDRATDRATDRVTDRATDCVTDRATDCTTDRGTDCVTDRTTDRATEGRAPPGPPDIVGPTPIAWRRGAQLPPPPSTTAPLQMDQNS
ncbi:uncharacterized protein LOC144305088 [Canis aureus]